MKGDLNSFFEEVAGDDYLQSKLRSIATAEDIIHEAAARGYHFSERELISHFAESLLRPNDDLASFLARVIDDEHLQKKLIPINTSEGIVAVASQMGYRFTAPDLINHFAEALLHADEAQTVILFDSLGWNFRSILSVLNQIHDPSLSASAPA